MHLQNCRDFFIARFLFFLSDRGERIAIPRWWDALNDSPLLRFLNDHIAYVLFQTENGRKLKIVRGIIYNYSSARKQ